MTRGRQVAARVLAIVGTVLVGLPLVAPLLLAAVLLVAGAGWRLDYLMPGELVAVVAVGGVILVAAAFLTARRRVLVGSLTVAVLVLFALVDVVAVATGLASGATEAEGWPLALVVTTYGLYLAAVVALVAAGALLSRDTFFRWISTGQGE